MDRQARGDTPVLRDHLPVLPNQNPGRHVFFFFLQAWRHDLRLRVCTKPHLSTRIAGASMDLIVGTKVRVRPGQGVMRLPDSERVCLEGRLGTVVEFQKIGVVVDIEDYGLVQMNTTEVYPLAPLEQLASEA